MRRLATGITIFWLAAGCGHVDAAIADLSMVEPADAQAGDAADASLAVTAPSRIKLGDVRSFEYVIAANASTAGIDPAIAQSRADLVLLGGTGPIDRAAADPTGGRLIFGYVDMCEAAAYWYPSLFSGGTVPSWFGNEDPGFPGLYTVQYWNAAWEPLLFQLVDQAVAHGYDGIFLDVLDGDNEWSANNRWGNPVYANATQALATLLTDVRAHIATTYPGQTVYLIGNNPTGLATQAPNVITNLDGIFNEVAFYGQSPTNGKVSVYEGTANATYIQSTLYPLYAAFGLPMFGNDYPSPLTDAAAISLSFDLYSALGWIPSVTTAQQTAAIFSTGPFLFMATPSASTVTGELAFTNYLSGGKTTSATLVGGNQGDYFIGGPGKNTITGGSGDDTIYAHPANAADKGQLVFVFSSTVKGTATIPSVSLTINGQPAVAATQISAATGTSTQSLAVPIATFAPVASVVVTITGASYTDQNNFSNVEVDALVYDGATVSPATGTYSSGKGSGNAFSNNGTVTFSASAFAVSDPFPPDTSDSIDGGGGMNSVVYRAQYSAYSVVRQSDGSYVVTASSTAEGPDTLTNIQTLVFADQQVTLN